MIRLIFALAFLLGAVSVVGMSMVFVGSDVLALTITVVIGAVYTIGTIELIQFQKATATLVKALNVIPDKIETLDHWLAPLHSSLKNTVRLRIEGERSGLPAPVLAPYLVGLLVMLGLLGTFVGMVDTLQGAVSALQGSTELSAIREGLAAPINGLGLAFGTSVAGVAASAMLGLMSTLSRRERIFATRDLDGHISSVFKGFSLTHNRQETYKALQGQAQALPAVAVQLQAMAEKLEQMGDRLAEQLNHKQDNFHASVAASYEGLASSVAETLKHNLAESGRIAGESIQPIVEASMLSIDSAITESAASTYQQMNEATQTQLTSLTTHFSDTSERVSKAWQVGLEAHQQTNLTLIDSIENRLGRYGAGVEKMNQTLLDSIEENAENRLAAQALRDQEKLQLWTEHLAQTHKLANDELTKTSQTLSSELSQLSENQQSALSVASENFAGMTATLTDQWQAVSTHTLSEQKEVTASLVNASQSINQHALETSEQLISKLSAFVATSERLVEARVEAESNWLSEHGQRVEGLEQSLQQGLSKLRNDEQARAQVALEQLKALEVSAAQQLSSLGKSLEEPMTRLIETASETPRAAAEVISKLREEVSNNIERDNSFLDERRRIMTDLDQLSNSLSASSGEQRTAVEQLVVSSTKLLGDISAKFDAHIGVEVSKLSDIAADFSGSALDIASMGDGFKLAVTLFNDSNSQLIENLNRIEVALGESSTRNNEQLGYYVAQAREIIDHSVMSQKVLFDEFQSQGQATPTVAEIS
jgi:hypothetical protein